MPVRSLTSPVLRWPDAETVHRAVTTWGRKVLRARPDVLKVGYIGSYAKGNWGVGSDLDLVVVVERSQTPPERRPAEWDVTNLPVPADLFVYTQEEFEALPQDSRFARVLRDESVWVTP